MKGILPPASDRGHICVSQKGMRWERKEGLGREGGVKEVGRENEQERRDGG